MRKSATIADHPIHPMLIVFPIGLWIFSFLSDWIFLMNWGSPMWSEVAFYTMIGGLIGALCAAVPGFVDYFTITDKKAATTANYHMVLNLVLVVLYALNVFLRMRTAPGSLLPVILSSIGVIILGVSGWFGGDLVYVQGMGVKAREPVKPEAKDKRRETEKLRQVR